MSGHLLETLKLTKYSLAKLMLLGVIASKNRRRGALVSLLYPYFFEDTFTANMPEVIEFSEPFEPIDRFNLSLPEVTLITLKLPIVEADMGLDDFSITIPQVNFIQLKLPIVNGSIPADTFSYFIPEVTFIKITEVVVPITATPDLYTLELPLVYSIILG